jgi:hypothetical protein
MGLLFPIFKTAAVLFVMAVELTTVYPKITTDVGYGIFSRIRLYLLKNPIVPG